jgi:hypothetical protein
LPPRAIARAAIRWRLGAAPASGLPWPWRRCSRARRCPRSVGWGLLEPRTAADDVLHRHTGAVRAVAGLRKRINLAAAQAPRHGHAPHRRE